MSKTTGFILISVGLALVLAEAMAQQTSKSTRRMNDFMRQKMAYAQLILEGLTLEKYDPIVTNGKKLWNMGRENLWQQVDTEEYKKHSQKFRDNVMALIDAGRDKKLEAARQSYSKTLQSCYDCHDYFRIAKLPPRKQYE